MKKIDVFNHIWPKPFFDALIAHIGHMTDITKRSGDVPMMTELDRRFEVMDMFGEDYVQILSLASPPLELLADPDKAVELSRIGSDAMADLCRKYPERFPGFIGTTPMTHPEGMIAESKYAIEDLGAVGMQIFTNVAGKALDAPEFLPFFEYMAKTGKPVWLHPARGENFSDYRSESRSEYEIWWTFGWPYETSAAMARLVFSGIFDKCPGLKVITHHAGGMVPFFEGRVGPGWDQMGKRTSDRDLAAVQERAEAAAPRLLQGLLRRHRLVRLGEGDRARGRVLRRQTTSSSPPTRRSIRRAARCTSARRSSASRAPTSPTSRRRRSSRTTSSTSSA